MPAMVLAAGFGSRLMPLTRHRPKCLMPVMNRPLLGLWLERLAGWGMGEVVVNTHHLAPQVVGWLERNPPPGLTVHLSHEPRILGTGGALVRARERLGGRPFLLVNADVICSARLPALEAQRKEQGALAVLGLVRDRRFDTVALDRKGRVLGFKDHPLAATPRRWLTYSGLAAFSPRFLDFLPRGGYSTLVEGLLAAVRAGRRVLGRELAGTWDDLGTWDRLWALHRDLAGSGRPGLECLRPPGPVLAAPGACIDPGARVEGFCVLGAGARIEGGTRVRDSLLLPGARVAAGIRVEGAILGDGFTARTDIWGGAHA